MAKEVAKAAREMVAAADSQDFAKASTAKGAVEKAVKGVAGVSTHTAAKGVKTFTVEGDFSTKELAAALNKAGFNGSIQ